MNTELKIRLYTYRRTHFHLIATLTQSLAIVFDTKSLLKHGLSNHEMSLSAVLIKLRLLIPKEVSKL